MVQELSISDVMPDMDPDAEPPCIYCTILTNSTSLTRVDAVLSSTAAHPSLWSLVRVLASETTQREITDRPIIHPLVSYSTREPLERRTSGFEIFLRSAGDGLGYDGAVLN